MIINKILLNYFIVKRGSFFLFMKMIYVSYSTFVSLLFLLNTHTNISFLFYLYATIINESIHLMIVSVWWHSKAQNHQISNIIIINFCEKSRSVIDKTVEYCTTFVLSVFLCLFLYRNLFQFNHFFVNILFFITISCYLWEKSWGFMSFLL